MKWLRLLGAAALLTSAQSVPAASSAHAMDKLASEKGCYLCHRTGTEAQKPNQRLPYAPSWTDIARRYKGQADAEDRLTEVVLGGSGRDATDRHWRGKVSDPGMLPNVKEIDEREARQLVHWVLSFVP